MRFKEIVEAGEMVVKKDDDKETVLVDPNKGTTTIIDKKKNPQSQIQNDPKDPNKAMMKDPTSNSGSSQGQKKAVVKPGTKVTITP
jgi:hypothetical protein